MALLCSSEEKSVSPQACELGLVSTSEVSVMGPWSVFWVSSMLRAIGKIVRSAMAFVAGLAELYFAPMACSGFVPA
ncbi:MAG: hypothetical protein M5U11_09820 [Anaerolineales bacterium]|nr:hypothetical protein [Anaerolineales bacterium]